MKAGFGEVVDGPGQESTVSERFSRPEDKERHFAVNRSPLTPVTQGNTPLGRALYDVNTKHVLRGR